jgi:hypothetical protein
LERSFENLSYRGVAKRTQVLHVASASEGSTGLETDGLEKKQKAVDTLEARQYKHNPFAGKSFRGSRRAGEWDLFNEEVGCGKLCFGL